MDEDDSEDLLHFKEDAELLVKYLIENASSDSAVGVAIMGTWGTGKTRFLKYMSEALEEYQMAPVYFNRLFSGMSITAYLPTFREAKRWLNMPLVMKTMCFSPVRAKDLEKEHFPLLSQYKPVGSGLSMPLDSVKINRDFWGTESRFKEPADYYFVQDAN